MVTGCKKGEKPTRQVEDDTLEFINDYTLSGDVCSILQAVPLMLSDRMFYREIAQLVREKRFTFGRLRQLFSVSLCGNHRALQARKWMRCHPEYQVDVIYSYWLQITAYAAVRLKQLEKLDDAFSISRTHGFDLYAERIKSNYMLEVLCNGHINRCCISHVTVNNPVLFMFFEEVIQRTNIRKQSPIIDVGIIL